MLRRRRISQLHRLAIVDTVLWFIRRITIIIRLGRGLYSPGYFVRAEGDFGPLLDAEARTSLDEVIDQSVYPSLGELGVED